jgi:hypothetical protein
MEKEEKKSQSHNEDQEELSNSEFGFVYNFFISEGKSGSLELQKIKEKNKSKLPDNNQSVIFFLPDFFTHDE